MATKKDIFDILQRIKYLPNSPVTDKSVDQIVEMFFVILKDLSFDMLDKATLFYLGQSTPFFPMPGTLRNKALELHMIALRIPTATEAWGMVVNRQTMQPGLKCETADRLEKELSGLIGGVYLLKIKEISMHEKECPVCRPTTFDPSYAHPMVEKTVRLLGGLDVLLTDNPVADRARFIQAYGEVLERERAVVGMIPEVAAFVEEKRLALDDDRRAALETGEADYIRGEYLKLADGMRR